MITSKELYSMYLHDKRAVNHWLDVFRVPGGWIYQDNTSNTSTFVPFNNEFQE